MSSQILDPTSALVRGVVPLYHQIANRLRTDIAGKVFEPGDLLPTETELMDRFQVSRVTIRQALAVLVQEGLVGRQAGRGTFVTAPEDRPGVWNFSTLEDIVTAGQQTEFQLLELETPPRDASQVPASLANQELTRIECLRWLEGTPISHGVIYLPTGFARRLALGQLPRTPQPLKPIIALLADQHVVRISKGTQVIAARAATPEMAEMLNVPVNAPLLQVERQYFDERGEVFHHAITHYRSDKLRYKFAFTRPTSLQE